MQNALDFIEEHLADNISLTEIAATAHFSSFHFARIFRELCGDSVMNYVRRRRLARAVVQLRQLTPNVLDIALSCGFGSQEAFTRAFTKQFGIAPATFRRNAHLLTLPTQRKLKMPALTIAPLAPPRMVQLDSFCVIGMAGEFQPFAPGIVALWDRFVPRIAEIPRQLGRKTYGVCCEGRKDPDHFTYIAAVQVASLDVIPEGMTGMRFDANEYAVFEHERGLGPALKASVQYILGVWLPNSGYELCGPDFELYPEDFDPAAANAVLEIWVSVSRL